MKLIVIERSDWTDPVSPEADPIEGYLVQNDNGQAGHLRLSLQYRQQCGKANFQPRDGVIVDETIAGGDWPVLVANAIRKL